MNARPSCQHRAGWPEPAEPIHLRAVEMASILRETAGVEGGVSEADLIAAGFTAEEIVEHFPAAQRVAAEALVRRAPEPGDRVPDILSKAIAAAVHRMPVTAGFTAGDAEAKAMVDCWARFCAARAAWKLDPWVSQGERCLDLLRRFLMGLPLLPGEVNRVLCGLAAHMKASRHG